MDIYNQIYIHDKQIKSRLLPIETNNNINTIYHSSMRSNSLPNLVSFITNKKLLFYYNK